MSHDFQKIAEQICRRHQRNLRLLLGTVVSVQAIITALCVTSDSFSLQVAAAGAWMYMALQYMVLYRTAGHFWNWWWLWPGPILVFKDFEDEAFNNKLLQLKADYNLDIYDYNFGVIKCRNKRIATLVKLVL